MFVVIIFIFGLIFGSFTNAYIWRDHQQSITKSKKIKKQLSIINGRSQCINCGHVLAAKDLVPLLSWLSLKGKCRYCKTPVSAQYPAVELATAVLFAVSHVFWPFALNGLGVASLVVWLFCVVMLMALFLCDLKWMLLPNRMVAILTGGAIGLVILQAVNVSSLGALLQPVLGGLVLASIFWALFQISKGRWIGGGDVKIAFSLGLIAGSPTKALLVIFLASLLGTLIVAPLLLSKKLKMHTKIPFGCFLIPAVIIVFLFGSSIIDRYLHKILYLN